MAKFSRFALFLLAGAVFTIPYASLSYAMDEMAEDSVEGEDKPVLSLDEAKELIMSKPTASDATSGKLSSDPAYEPYDLYSRQMAYREHAKALRATIDQRRVNYDAPRTAMIESFRDLQETVFAAETAAYQEKVAAESLDEDDLMDEDEVPVVEGTSDADQRSDQGEQTASVDGEDGKGLTERDIPAQPGEEEKVKKKVVTTDDAPDFDPSNL